MCDTGAPETIPLRINFSRQLPVNISCLLGAMVPYCVYYLTPCKQCHHEVSYLATSLRRAINQNGRRGALTAWIGGKGSCFSSQIRLYPLQQ